MGNDTTVGFRLLHVHLIVDGENLVSPFGGILEIKTRHHAKHLERLLFVLRCVVGKGEGSCRRVVFHQIGLGGKLTLIHVDAGHQEIAVGPDGSGTGTGDVVDLIEEFRAFRHRPGYVAGGGIFRSIDFFADFLSGIANCEHVNLGSRLSILLHIIEKGHFVFEHNRHRGGSLRGAGGGLAVG